MHASPVSSREGRSIPVPFAFVRRTVLAEATKRWEPRGIQLLAALLEALGDRFDELEAVG